MDAKHIQQNWLLPDGVADVLFTDAQKQESLRDALLFVLTAHGYRLVSPPLIEYTESLLNNADEDLKRQTFKFIDQLNGRLMGLRADITPQILRIDSKYGQGVSRYCYVGQVVKTLPTGLFGLRTPLQLGAEIFGVDDIRAELELIDLLAALLDEIGLDREMLHVDIGHVAIFDRLCQLHEVSSKDADELIGIYHKKAMPELAKWCQNIGQSLSSPSDATDFLVLAKHTLSSDRTPNADALLSKLSDKARQDDDIIQAANELATLAAHIRAVGMSVSIDVTELSGYHYHTGVVFDVYLSNRTTQTQALVRGGRFDGISTQGVARGATGFSMDINRLLEFVELEEDTVIWVDYHDLQNADADTKADLAVQIKILQSEGCIVIKPLTVDDKPDQIDGILHWDTDQDKSVWAVRLVGDDC
ncbi:ATP phosphoribosyltransferase regulatory subunit [Moraxella catarrhalis]|uniref:ATP phosphoribosyltransferase regulatory subunit n=2 Tax=Moraxella catarrhalis TaxID=480 RepID=A0A198UEI2_MORCA|nr:ATP phosphoribosyltransferase regulatory subunit [Moraxella catarrhalis]OAU94795.1 ATP phosphoribosyltransferase regulatory subunit [Moraxella catarrhalis]OAU99604.1 ATP phosphoribosyltransferase regulatory subunit [Moraxella catarrhalis]